jgi:hypothetical protein
MFVRWIKIRFLWGATLKANHTTREPTHLVQDSIVLMIQILARAENFGCAINLPRMSSSSYLPQFIHQGLSLLTITAPFSSYSNFHLDSCHHAGCKWYRSCLSCKCLMYSMIWATLYLYFEISFMETVTENELVT